MNETVIITDANFAPARSFVPERLRQLSKISIREGTGAELGMMPPNKRVCIMEAIAYILGYERINDAPPCTSDAIRHFMIGLNDEIESNRKRAQLKQVVTDIVNTAPTHMRQTNRSAINPIYELKTITKDPRYREAERTRGEMIEEFEHTNRKPTHELPMTELIEFIRKLAAVAKFDTVPVEDLDA